ncbi:MAG: HNH/ENDO VII family nuclease [Desulfobulbus sp.]|nr:HNH/ENDO VII family nuclease [Desulfobulbus sp.]
MLEHLIAIATRGTESISEVFKETAIKCIRESPVLDCMETIENSSLESLKAQNATQLIETDDMEQNEAEPEETANNESEGLTDEEKKQIKDETNWSDEVINAISTMKEYEIYKNAGLQEVEINGKKVLVKSDIDWDQKDSVGRTNKERAEAGLSPINKDGDTIELHHIGQKNDGSIAELTPDEHRGKENYLALHNTKKESEIDRVAFNNERKDHWEARANAGDENA